MRCEIRHEAARIIVAGVQIWLGGWSIEVGFSRVKGVMRASFPAAVADPSSTVVGFGYASRGPHANKLGTVLDESITCAVAARDGAP